MYEVTTHDLMIFVVLGFCSGIFASIFLARFLEVVHTWRLVQETVLYLLLMCAKIVEDVAFLTEVKRKHMKAADFTSQQIRQFEEVDDKTLTNWKDSVILSIVKRAPPHFKSMLPFQDWNGAMKFMNNTLKGD
tara:strand:- start:4565 stop:4963 length:399 start_codon:yes stop_codon:yes gene_type:complete